jgi:hypothetical protein
MHLVGYLYEDYHGARSLEHKKSQRVVPLLCHVLVKVLLFVQIMFP